ncbi:MAG: relaxase/mobilization nuclease domain-containing protein, partial [Tannerellaceae bacterium]|nr:relaxase/mobilization nuclease domain-containing protein [Tannerellaceae bacterium]
MNEEKAEILATHLLRLPTDNTTALQNLMNEFNTYIPSHIKTENPVIHISLNPHPQDRLDNYQYVQIAEEYMQSLGYGDQPYVIYKHNDIQREHLHIVSLRVNKNGKKINDSFEKLRSKKITEELEKKFNLHPAQNPEQRNKKILPLTFNQKPEEIKKQIQSIAYCLIKEYSFHSIGELRTLLSLYNISLEEVKGEINGKSYHGLVYSALNEKGEKITHPIPSSQFGKYMGYKYLSDKIQKFTEKIRASKLKERTKRVIDKYVKNNRNERELKAQLKDEKIDVIFRRNQEGRIYGVTFIDHNSRTVFNGSRLGKEYSVNFFNEKFNTPIQKAKTETPKFSPIVSPTDFVVNHKETDSVWKDFSFTLIDFKNLSLPFIEHSKEEDVSWLYRK